MKQIKKPEKVKVSAFMASAKAILISTGTSSLWFNCYKEAIAFWPSQDKTQPRAACLEMDKTILSVASSWGFYTNMQNS